MKSILTVVFAIIPILGLVVVAWLIWKKEMKQWQNYACLTVLVVFASLVFGTLAGRVTSFGYGDARVQGVEQKVQEARELVAEIRRLAKTTGELSVIATQPQPIGHLTVGINYPALIAHYTKAKQKIEDVLRQAWNTDAEIQKTVEPLTNEIQRLEAEQEKEAKPK